MEDRAAASIDEGKFDAAVKLLRDDVGDMLSALGVEYGSDAAHRTLKTALAEFITEYCKFRGSGIPRKIVVR